MLTAEQAHQILDKHPLFKKTIIEWTTLLDAADVLDGIDPQHHKHVAAYLREMANTHILKRTTLPADFIQVMASSRPPLCE